MDSAVWNVILFSGKWVFIGLIYFILVMVVMAVRREMLIRVEGQPALSPAAPGRLKIIRAGSDTAFQAGMMVDLKPVTNIGKESDNDLVFQDQYISRHHTRLFWDGSTWWIEDLSSKNGTFLNGQTIPAEKPQQAPAGSKVAIGGMAFELLV